MANITLLRNSNRGVVRIVRILVVRQMATHARRTGKSVIRIHVALSALQSGVKTSERPAG